MDNIELRNAIERIKNKLLVLDNNIFREELEKHKDGEIAKILNDCGYLYANEIENKEYTDNLKKHNTYILNFDTNPSYQFFNFKSINSNQLNFTIGKNDLLFNFCKTTPNTIFIENYSSDYFFASEETGESWETKAA